MQVKVHKIPITLGVVGHRDIVFRPVSISPNKNPKTKFPHNKKTHPSNCKRFFLNT
jgi:hypothetical protein